MRYFFWVCLCCFGCKKSASRTTAEAVFVPSDDSVVVEGCAFSVSHMAPEQMHGAVQRRGRVKSVTEGVRLQGVQGSDNTVQAQCYTNASAQSVKGEVEVRVIP